MRRVRAAIAVCALVIVILAVFAGGYAYFVGVHSAPDGTYVEVPSSIHASLRATATSGHVALRVNKVADASTPEMRAAWERFNVEKASALYGHPLVPPAGEKYLVANITVKNTASRAVPCTSTDLYLVGRDGSTYYANYAAAPPSSAQILENQTLSGGATNTLYVLFAAPSQAQPTKLVYTAHPPIVVSLA